MIVRGMRSSASGSLIYYNLVTKYTKEVQVSKEGWPTTAQCVARRLASDVEVTCFRTITFARYASLKSGTSPGSDGGLVFVQVIVFLSTRTAIAKGKEGGLAWTT